MRPLGFLGDAEAEVASGVAFDVNRGTRRGFAREDHLRKRGLDMFRHHSAQGSGTVLRLVAQLGQAVFGLVGGVQAVTQLLGSLS